MSTPKRRPVPKRDPNPGYERTVAHTVKTKSGQEVTWLDGMVLVELREEYRRAGLSWPGEERK
ncbi:hypothetical protein EA658_09920 [Pseudoxanthomonas winnipegensis]|uniref:Transposase n=1 Tax=Pseudoxanthomonas winnipegensis TaxID=2480810 RepID=A0ABY1WCW9_9GAMM|nr:hypothetical protein [Pseudoxanthomonas winnipegensis]TAA12451.1 hypothetical protein EA659_03730 [Pseudoxanthomonas winnipegensis]TAA19184.1 hypothetical protein EA658_09920 [Pseudoxanthomonas winnipegensis]TAH70445.1 hypothetical protein EA657_16985 [Pseudoxanthomonas winnipegensis]